MARPVPVHFIPLLLDLLSDNDSLTSRPDLNCSLSRRPSAPPCGQLILTWTSYLIFDTTVGERSGGVGVWHLIERGGMAPHSNGHQEISKARFYSPLAYEGRTHLYNKERRRSKPSTSRASGRYGTRGTIPTTNLVLLQERLNVYIVRAS